jgi:coproporphyrinogen III oxidase
MSTLKDMEALVRRTQDEITSALTALDGVKFREDVWSRPEGGGGVSRMLEDGKVLERAAVNVSAVSGTLSPEAAVAMSHGRAHLAEVDRRFDVAGISLVLHPKNPFAPTCHANYRYFQRGPTASPEAWWFGGGADLTPSYLFAEDAQHFHRVHRAACDRHDPGYYPRFKAWADDYFLIEHRHERRGVGGIFFDDLTGPDPKKLFAFVESCASSFVEAYVPILARRMDTPFEPHHRRWQELRRGRYVEFNLMYDRGTKFGLATQGRIESILLSLPRIARWEYDVVPAPGSPEAALVEVLRTPRAWL